MAQPDRILMQLLVRADKILRQTKYFVTKSKKTLCSCLKGTYLQSKCSGRADIHDIRVTHTHTHTQTHTHGKTTVSSRCACAPRLNKKHQGNTVLQTCEVGGCGMVRCAQRELADSKSRSGCYPQEVEGWSEVSYFFCTSDH